MTTSRVVNSQIEIKEKIIIILVERNCRIYFSNLQENSSTVLQHSDRLKCSCLSHPPSRHSLHASETPSLDHSKNRFNARSLVSPTRPYKLINNRQNQNTHCANDTIVHLADWWLHGAWPVAEEQASCGAPSSNRLCRIYPTGC